MNIFVIPSWYPSKSNQLNGIFVKEQVLSIAKMYDDINFGISTWGQNDEEFLLYAGKPLSSIQKLARNHESSLNTIIPNVEEYFSPAYSFTSKLLKGNIDKIVEANCANYRSFENQYGKPDVIHAHVCYKAGYVAQQISKKFSIPYMITEHMGPFPQKYHLDRRGELLPDIKNAIEDSDALAAVSSDLREVMKSYGIKNEIQVIPNFIEPVSFNQSTKPKDKFSFVTLSGMSFGKGIKELLEAIRMAIMSTPDMHFTMVGGGPDLAEFKSLTATLKLSDYVTWTGMVPKEKVGQYLNRSDAHILVSHYDSFGVSYIEAMAHGLPNIAAALGGPKDIVDSETGVLVEKIEPQIIADKIIWMKNNYHLFDPKHIVTSFRRRFSTEVVAPRIRMIYESLI